MKFSLFEVFYWQGTEWSVAFFVIETSSRESALLSVSRFLYLKEWQFDFFYFEFIAAWLRDLPEESPANKACSRLKLLVGKIIRSCVNRFSG